MKAVLSTPPETVAEYPSELTEGPVEVELGEWVHFWHHMASSDKHDDYRECGIAFTGGEWSYKGMTFTDMVICDSNVEA